MAVVAGTPAVDIPSAVRKIGVPFRSALKMMALRFSRFLAPARMDDIASVVASLPSDAGAHDIRVVSAIATACEPQMLIASAPAIANGRTFSNLSMTARSTASVDHLGITDWS